MDKQYQKQCPIDGGTCGQGGTCFVCENEALGSQLATARERIAELETLIADIKAWDVDKAAQEIARGQDLNLQVPPEIRKRMQALLEKQAAQLPGCGCGKDFSRCKANQDGCPLRDPAGAAHPQHD